MQSIFLKDFRHFFHSLSGYISIGLFLLIMGLFLFVFPETSLLDYGYATMEKFFELAPWILMMLVPAITMRSLSDEFRTGTWELLRTRPVSLYQLILGKFLASYLVGVIALLPSFFYVFTIYQLSIGQALDMGSIAGAYLGLFLLLALFTGIGIFCSSLTSNPIIAYLTGAFASFLLYFGFKSISAIPVFQGNADYWIQHLGAAVHYNGMSRGVIEWPAAFYFMGLIAFFIIATQHVLAKK
jgi:ABC-2 type transport system permease protein